MLPDRVSNPGPLTYESGTLPIAGGGTPPPKPPSKEGVNDWVKKQLPNLAGLLANLAMKAAAVIPELLGP